MSKQTLADKWISFITHHPLMTILFSILLALSLAYGARGIQISSDYRYFFGPDNPQRVAFDKLQNVYDQDDSVLITVTPDDGVVFKKNTLLALQYLTDKAWKLPYATRVDSITNFQYSSADADDLTVRDLIRPQDILHPTGVLNAKDNLNKDSPGGFEALKQTALAEPLIKNRLLNPEASVTGVNVRMRFPAVSPLEVPEAAKAARQLADHFKQRFPGHQVHLTGMVMMNDAFNAAGMRDMTVLIPVMYLIITVLLFFMLRSGAAVVTTLCVMFLSIAGGVGFAGWAGIPITPPSSIAPTVIMTLAIANCVHILKSMFKLMTAGHDKPDALRESLKINLRPVFLTSITTMIGFLSLNFSDTPPFQDLGNITAFGVLIAFIMSVTLLPAMVTKLPVRGKYRQGGVDLSKRYTAFLKKRQYWIGASVLFATVFLAMQIPNIKINDRFVGYFDHSMDFRPASEYTIKHLSGIYFLHFDLNSGRSQGISDPNYLRAIDAFSNHMHSIEGVVHVNSISDTFKRLNKNMHGDDDAYYRLPETRELASQYLLLYEMNLPYGLDLNTQINVDKSSSRVIVTLDDVPTSRILEIAGNARQWLQTNTPPSMHASGTSPTMMFSHITRRNIESMLWGTAVAFTLITITMIIALRSFRYGLISLIPNLVPAVLAIGLWSMLVGEAGFSIAFVASVTLGIIVDDTVHFISKYVTARRDKNLSTDQSIHYALQHVSGALIATSIILVAGFSILMLSGFKLNFVLGSLSALTIAIALIIDFSILPVVLRMADGKITAGVFKMKYATSTAIIALIAIGLSTVVHAGQTPGHPIEYKSGTAGGKPSDGQKGLWVAQQIDKAEMGFVNQTAKVTMTLRNKHGQSAKRRLRIKILEVRNDGDKSLTIFESPGDVKGTAFLSFSHVQQPDDQWLYLPALRRVKRISSNNKSGPFMGSEFAYEDLSSQEVDKYTYKYLSRDTVAGELGHVVERIPRDPNSGYSKQIIRVDAVHWRIHKIQYFDRKNTLLKTLRYEDYRQYANGKWRADTMIMQNHQNGKLTHLHWQDIRFNQKISSRDFSKTALKRIR